MCEHNTSVVFYYNGKIQVSICEWGCGRILIHEDQDDLTTKLVREFEHPELAALRERVAALERWRKSENIELLSLIADLAKSEDRSRQAIGVEVKRLTAALRKYDDTTIDPMG